MSIKFPRKFSLKFGTSPKYLFNPNKSYFYSRTSAVCRPNQSQIYGQAKFEILNIEIIACSNIRLFKLQVFFHFHQNTLLKMFRINQPEAEIILETLSKQIHIFFHHHISHSSFFLLSNFYPNQIKFSKSLLRL